MAQLGTIVGRENVVHRTQPTCTYNAPKPEQKTVQEVLNDLKKYAMQMIHPPDIYMFCKWFVLAFCDSLRNDMLKKRL